MKLQRSKAGLLRQLAMPCVALSMAVAGVMAQTQPAPDTGPRVALVGDLEIRKGEFDARYVVTSAEYRKRTGKNLTPDFSRVLRRVTLETLIRDRLLILEAARRGIAVSDAEAEAEFKNDPFFRDQDVFNSARYEAAKTRSPKAFKDALAQIKRRLAGRKLHATLKAEHRPRENDVKAQVERALRRARVSFVGLRRADFAGAFPEPRERDVLDYYRKHSSDFRRPPTAFVSMVEIVSPNATAGDHGSIARADSALAGLRSGTDLDVLGDRYGAAHRNVEISADSLPASWRGSHQDLQAVLQVAPGAVLDRPVASSRGWLAVRVDERLPERSTPFAGAAAEIRRLLRDDIRDHHDERELRALYEARKDSLRVRASRIRYAVLDTTRMKVPEPDASDLDLYYRSHLADYTSYDAASASIKSRPLAEVKGEVRERWQRDQRTTIARDWSERLTDAWRNGRRDRALEAKATLVRDVGPVPHGALVDTSAVGRILTQVLPAERKIGGGSLNYPGGYVVYHVHTVTNDLSPTFEQALPALREVRAALIRDEEERGALALFQRDSLRFTEGEVITLTRIEIPTFDPLVVPLSRKEVEGHFQTHFSKYSTPEQIRVRHILVSPETPGPEGDAAARAEAEALRARIENGDDFARLAREHSDDPPTQGKGGDLGYFERGQMLEAFEDAAFKLQPGQISAPVKSDVGYHIIKCEDHQPVYVEPLEFIYATVGADAALEKGERLATALAESLYHASKTPNDVLAGALKLGIKVKRYRHVRGTAAGYPGVMQAPMTKLEKLQPGVLYPGAEFFKGIGAVIMWVDNVSPPKTPTWFDARDRAVALYRSETGGRSLAAKRAEFDSMLSAGVTLDSLGALVGGLHGEVVTLGKGLGDWGEAETLDSLLFGARSDLSPGQTSDWVELPLGPAKVRLEEWISPNPTMLASRVDSERATGMQRNLFEYFDALKKKNKVQILDPDLKGVALPRIEDM